MTNWLTLLFIWGEIILQTKNVYKFCLFGVIKHNFFIRRSRSLNGYYEQHNIVAIQIVRMTILMMSKQHNSVGVHTVKPNVLDALFQLKVGNERISMQDSLDRIISTTTTDGNPFTVQISAESWKKYNECNNQGKEYLSGSLHKCLAFNYLCSEAENGFQ